MTHTIAADYDPLDMSENEAAAAPEESGEI